MIAHDDAGDEKIKRAATQYHNAGRLASIMRRPRIARRPRAPERRRTETAPFETRHLSGGRTVYAGLASLALLEHIFQGQHRAKKTLFWIPHIQSRLGHGGK